MSLLKFQCCFGSITSERSTSHGETVFVYRKSHLPLLWKNANPRKYNATLFIDCHTMIIAWQFVSNVSQGLWDGTS